MNPLSASGSNPAVQGLPSFRPSPSVPADPRGTASFAGVSFVMDVPVQLSVEIGRRKARIAELVHIAPGAVLELDSSASDPLSIYVNGRLVARGEAVMVGDRYGVRIIELLIAKGDDESEGQ